MIKLKNLHFVAIVACAYVFAFGAPIAKAGYSNYDIQMSKVTAETASTMLSTDLIKIYDTVTAAGAIVWVAATDIVGLGSATWSLDQGITLDDGTTDSPALTFQDATNETAVLLKVDGANTTLTIVSTDDFEIVTGNLKVGNATPGVTQNGEDFFVEGTSEFDGAAQFDGSLTANGTVSFTGATFIGDGAVVMHGFVSNQIASTTTTITASQCGSHFISNSADVLTLPEASTVLGCVLKFTCGTADDFDINPNDATDFFSPVSTTNGTTAVVTLTLDAGDAIRCTDIGGSITIEAIAADIWAQVGGGNGIWTDVS